NEVGTHASVKALVFVAAFEPDVGESVADLSDKMPAAAKSVGPATASSPWIPMRLRPISRPMRLSRSRASWRSLRYRVQVTRLARRPRLQPGNKSRATQSLRHRTE